MRIKQVLKTIAKTRLSGLLSFLYQTLASVLCCCYSFAWFLRGSRKPSREEREKIGSQVTFIFKSFERQKLAKRLYRSIRSYYPNVRVIIADDSSKPLKLSGDKLTVLQLPFNSGLSYGLKRALELVETPFTVRMDDDEKLCLHTRLGEQLAFLERHPEVDLVSVLPLCLPRHFSTEISAANYGKNDMRYAPKKLLIPHLTEIEKDRYVVGKAPNRYLVRTEKLRAVGYDEKIRMLDHDDFYYRAAGNIVSVLDVSACVFHQHNPFIKGYAKYRADVAGDVAYIRQRRIADAEKLRAERERSGGAPGAASK